MEKSFNLLRWFSLLSFVCVAIIGVIIAVTLSRYMSEHMVRHDAKVSQEFIESIVLAEDTWSYFINRETSEAKTILDSFFNHIVHLPAVVRGNIYGADRTVIWSSNEKFIGKKNGANPELEEAFAGQLIAQVGFVHSDDKPEHVDFDSSLAGTKIIETYIPIFDRPRVQVVGVVEIYKRSDALIATIEQGTRFIWVGAAAGGLVLYLILFGIVYRAHTFIQIQQEKLIESETMAAIGEMASAVAHGIRNPLASIRSSAELTLDAPNDEARESASDIIAESDRLDRWLRELLVYSRPTCAPASPNSESANINEVVSQHLNEFSLAIERQGVNLIVDLQEALPRALGQGAVLGQVFAALVTNALDVLNSEGELKIKTWADQVGNRVVVEIADNGSGFSEAELKQLFKSSFTTKRGGLGLGLALSKRIVTRYGGSLEVQSTEGKGTIATIRVPTLRRF
jgi:signal transduction histidine kinase